MSVGVCARSRISSNDLKEKMMGKTEWKFVYVIYIRTTPEFMKTYWMGVWAESDWKEGSSWKLMFPDGRVADSGEIVEAKRPERLVIRWRNEFRPELKEEGYSKCTMQIVLEHEQTKLTVTHEIEATPPSKFIEAVSGGWPINIVRSRVPIHSDLREAMSMEKRYLTSALSNLS